MTKWVCSVCGYVYEGEKAPFLFNEFIRDARK